jgi:hypothetical protein
MNIVISIHAANSNVTASNRPHAIEINYSRMVTDADKSQSLVPTSLRTSLDERYSASIVLEQAEPNAIQVNILSPDHSALLQKIVNANKEGKAQIQLSDEEITLIEQGRQTLPSERATTSVTRVVRLLPTGSGKIDYARSNIAVTPIISNQETAFKEVNELFHSDGKRNSSLDITGQSVNVMKTFSWMPAHLAVDGTFSATFKQQPSFGWLWWLVGEQQVLGYIADNLSVEDKQTRLVALPAISQNPEIDSSDCDCARHVSADVTEAELANNPGVYSEDPGAFCRPFSNPERVLSEKRFSVIARITQPAIGAMGSTKTKSMRLLDWISEPTDNETSNKTTLKAKKGNLTSKLKFSLSESFIPVRDKLSDKYSGLLRQMPSARTTMNENNPLQWEDDIAQYQASTVAIGHILEFRVRWRSNGYSLGNVAKTLTLAPRQTKRIQKIDWSRTEKAKRQERTSIDDRENDSVHRERDYSDSVAANLKEWAAGQSSSSSAGIAGGVGFFGEGVIGGIGGGAATSSSSSHQNGGRQTTASEQQRLRDAIRRHGDALRKYESTVVTEISQEENVTGTTEIIRNANYAHSLTVIYYQILRHLKVTTEFSGVRECIFVPFSIRAFDYQRAYRWRDAIRNNIRAPQYARALRYLKDVASNFETSDIPPNRRADAPLNQLRGSIYINLGIVRPVDDAEGNFYALAWQILQPYLSYPALGVFTELSALQEAARDRVFQEKHAPSVAARWANKLAIKIGNRNLNADFTLASRYAFNQGVRLDFTVSPGDLAGLTRSSLETLTVTPLEGLPPGSIANLTRFSFTYGTERFERAQEGRTGVNDLISIADGTTEKAVVTFPLDSWECINEQQEIRESVNQLIEHLNEHVEYYHKAIWWNMDRDRLLMMMDGFYVPNTNNVSIASVIDREPVGVIGNCLVYRVGAASFLGNGKITTPAELYDVYAEKEPVVDPLHISLPTDGLYAQSIMDECMALEEHYGNTDWALNQPEPELGTIDPSLMQSRRTDPTQGTTPTNLPNTIINLMNAPDAPAPSGLQGVLTSVGNAGAFRDMAGLSGTQANTQAAFNSAASLASSSQGAALELAKLAKADQATKTADQKIASIKKAKDAGLTNDADAAAHTKAALSAMNPDAPKTEAPHSNPAINSAIEAAKNISGSTIEATTGEGSVKVGLGGVPDNAAPRSYIIPTSDTGGSQNRAFNPKNHDKSGVITLSVRIENMPIGGTVEWRVPLGEVGHFTLAGGRTTQLGFSTEVTGLIPGKTSIEVRVLNATGTIVESAVLPLCIPQFVSVDIDAAQFTPILTRYGLVSQEINQVLENARAVADVVLDTTNVRTVWLPLGETLPPQFASGGVASANVTRAIYKGEDPSGRSYFGLTKGRTGTGEFVGPQHFDESIDIYVGSYDNPIGSGDAKEVDDVTLKVLEVIANSQMESSAEKDLAIKVIGRLYGETLAHEIIHSIIGKTLTATDGFHNRSPGKPDDLMNHGSERSFEKRTGFRIDAALIGVVDIQTLLMDDLGIHFIDIPTTDAQAQINAHFPVPPNFK